MTKKNLFYIIQESAGLIRLGKSLNDSRRTYPSAGARYPLELYPIILKCDGMKKGLYHYNVKENCLELLLEKDLGKWIVQVTGNQKWIEKATVIFAITGVFDRTRIKYGERGYRYVLIETGHLGQNIGLLVAELGLGSCALGGFIDSEVNTLLDINLQQELILYLIAVGCL
jgi:SagB-type dehydrogenase family enzyme